MNKDNFSTPMPLRNISITDKFWKSEMELVRKEVIPYQWDTLNDRVEGAAPSFCMRNFKVAGKIAKAKKEQGSNFQEPKYTFRGFEALPEDMNHLEDKFYGFVFQDSDFAKWIEAVGYSLTQYPDAELEKIADEAIDIVCAAQQENGYLDTYYIINGMDKIFTNLRDNHELYCFGHLAEGAVAYYEATGKDKLLKAVEKYADFIISCFGEEEGKCKGYPGHEIAEMALIRLYEVSNNSKYLELSRFFVEERGKKPYYFDKEDHPGNDKPHKEELRYHYHQAHLPVREQNEAVGHAVRAVYLYSGMADLARHTHDEELFKACENLWNSIVNEKLYITGGIGGTHIGEAFSFPYDLPNDTAYSETCAAIGLAFFARRMLQIKADSKYADVMELALHNTVLSGMALDGKSFFYVNPLESNPEACHKDERKFHVRPVRQKWFGCACCPPNITRIVSSIGNYAYTETEETLFMHMYLGSVIEKKIENAVMDIKVSSAFPWNGNVEVEIEGEQEKEFTIAFRIPGWCKNPTIQTSGNPKIAIHKGISIDGMQTHIKDGYLYVKNTWKSGDKLLLDFPMEAQLVQAHSKVRENENRVALIRGPVVYCMEEADNGKNLHRLLLSQEGTFVVKEEEINHNPIISLSTMGLRKVSTENSSLYQVYEQPKMKQVTIKFVPYYTWANRGEGEMSVWAYIN